MMQQWDEWFRAGELYARVFGAMRDAELQAQQADADKRDADLATQTQILQSVLRKPMDDAVAAGDITLLNAIDHWKEQCARLKADLRERDADKRDAERWRFGSRYGFPVKFVQSHPPTGEISWRAHITDNTRYGSAEEIIDAAIAAQKGGAS